MTNDAPPAAGADARRDWAAEARGLVRAAMTATLATLDRDDGTPYASLVAVATLHNGSPLLLLSKLALHTRNALADARVSLLVDRREGVEGALTGPRVTLTGRLSPTMGPRARSRYLGRHPGAAMYADFGDFAFYEMTIARAYFIGGFGRITPLPAAELLEPVDGAGDLLEAEASVLSHMNEDHAAAVALMARMLDNAGDGPWRLTGVDPGGCDLVSGNRGLRLTFPHRVATADEVRRVFIALVAQARQGQQPSAAG